MKEGAAKKVFNGISKIKFIGPDQFMMVSTAGETRYFNSRGELHREDGPAVIDKRGNEQWFQEGLLHREGGPAVIEAVYFDPGYGQTKIATGQHIMHWYQYGIRHREDGPAMIYPEQRSVWFPNGRDNDPVERIVEGHSYWCINGEFVDPPEQQATQAAKPRDAASGP